MDTARPSAERRWKRRIQLAQGSTFVSLVMVAVIWGPLDRPGEAILFAMLTLLLGLACGMEMGRNRKRFLPVVGPGPRISESSGPNGYRSFDVTEGQFELTDAAVGVVGLLALANAPFIGPVIAEEVAVPEGLDSEWETTWLLHTRDSVGRPVFLDESAIVAMLAYTRAGEDFEPLDGALRSLVRLRRLGAKSR